MFVLDEELGIEPKLSTVLPSLFRFLPTDRSSSSCVEAFLDGRVATEANEAAFARGKAVVAKATSWPLGNVGKRY